MENENKLLKVLMTEIKRHTDSGIVDLIKGNFVEDGSYTKNVCADELKFMIDTNPDDVCVLVGWKEDKIAGHIVAWLPAGRNYIWIDQAWHDNGDVWSSASNGFDVLEDWAKSKNVLEFRMETNRSALPIIRRWGFTEHSLTMTRPI